VYKISNNKATCHTVSIGGVSGTQYVCNMRKEHFENLYNSRTESTSRVLFEEKMGNCLLNGGDCYISVIDVISAVNSQKHNRAPEPDGLLWRPLCLVVKGSMCT